MAHKSQQADYKSLLFLILSTNCSAMLQRSFPHPVYSICRRFFLWRNLSQINSLYWLCLGSEWIQIRLCVPGNFNEWPLVWSLSLASTFLPFILIKDTLGLSSGTYRPVIYLLTANVIEQGSVIHLTQFTKNPTVPLLDKSSQSNPCANYFS